MISTMTTGGRTTQVTVTMTWVLPACCLSANVHGNGSSTHVSSNIHTVLYH